MYNQLYTVHTVMNNRNHLFLCRDLKQVGQLISTFRKIVGALDDIDSNYIFAIYNGRPVSLHESVLKKQDGLVDIRNIKNLKSLF